MLIVLMDIVHTTHDILSLNTKKIEEGGTFSHEKILTVLVTASSDMSMLGRIAVFL